MLLQKINESSNPIIQMNDPDMTWLGIYAIFFKIILPILYVLIIIFLLYKFFKMFKKTNQYLQEINRNTELIGEILARKMKDEKEKDM